MPRQPRKVDPRRTYVVADGQNTTYPNVSFVPSLCENYLAPTTTQKNTHDSSIIGNKCSEDQKPGHSHAGFVFAPGVFTRPLPGGDAGSISGWTLHCVE